MSDQEKPEFGPDPELYARMSKPYASQAEADASIKRFMLGIKKLREECGIAEVLMMVANHVDAAATGAGKNTVTCQALVLGSPDFRPELGAMAFQLYTAPFLERADRLREMSTAGYDEEHG